LERIPSLKDARSLGGQQSGGKEFPVFGLISETDFPPLDRRPDSSLSGVVGGFHALMVHEGEQVVPMFEETSGGTRHVVIRGQLIGLETIADSCSDGDRFCDKGPSVDMPVSEGMPEGKQASDFREHPSCEPYAIGTPTRMFEALEGPDDMGPTDLPCPLVIGVVRRKHVRTDDPVEDFSEDSLEHLCSPRCGYMVERYKGRDDDPKPAALPLLLPSGLVDVEDRLFRQGLLCLFMGRRQGFGDLLMEFADRPERNVDPENRLGDFLAAPASYSVQTRQMGKQCGKPRSKT